MQQLIDFLQQNDAIAYFSNFSNICSRISKNIRYLKSFQSQNASKQEMNRLLVELMRDSAQFCRIMSTKDGQIYQGMQELYLLSKDARKELNYTNIKRQGLKND